MRDSEDQEGFKSETSTPFSHKYACFGLIKDDFHRNSQFRLQGLQVNYYQFCSILMWPYAGSKTDLVATIVEVKVDG